MNLFYKLFFLAVAIVGIIAIFFVSWFWSLLALPMVIVLTIDIISSVLKKKS